MAQVNEVTAERQCLEDNIYHLKSEVVAASTSLSEALDQLEKEKAAAVSSHCSLALAQIAEFPKYIFPHSFPIFLSDLPKFLA